MTRRSGRGGAKEFIINSTEVRNDRGTGRSVEKNTSFGKSRERDA